jgi:hypothetical protein
VADRQSHAVDARRLRSCLQAPKQLPASSQALTILPSPWDQKDTDTITLSFNPNRAPFFAVHWSADKCGHGAVAEMLTYSDGTVDVGMGLVGVGTPNHMWVSVNQSSSLIELDTRTVPQPASHIYYLYGQNGSAQDTILELYRTPVVSRSDLCMTAIWESANYRP